MRLLAHQDDDFYIAYLADVLCRNTKKELVLHKNNPSSEGLFLFLCFFVHGLSAAPFAKLLELDLALNKLLILAGPIVNTLTFGAGELYEAVLRHIFGLKIQEARPLARLP